MSDSAFGIVHSEISKVRFRRVSPQASQQIKDSYAKSQARKAKFRAAGQKIADAPGKVANAKVSLNDIGRGVGMGTAKVGTAVGRGLSYKPGLTGAAVIGGTGYGLYRHGNTKKKKVDTAPAVVTKSAFGVEDVEKARDRKKGAIIGGTAGAVGGAGAMYGAGAWGREAFGYSGAGKVKGALNSLHLPTAGKIAAGTAAAGAGIGAAIGRKKKPAAVVKSAFGVEDIDKALRFPGVQPFGPGAAKYTGDAAKHLKGLKKAPVTKKPEIGGGKIHTEKGNR